jgi:hypothetical protein
MTPLAARWKRFVAADSTACTFGRLSFALVISILFFPFGTGIIVALWALGIPVRPALAIGKGVLEQPAQHAIKILIWLFAAALILPTVLGSMVNLLDEDGALTLGRSISQILEYSIFPNAIQSWIVAYGKSPHSGAQFAVCSFVISVGTSLMLAELMRLLTFLPNASVGGFRSTSLKNFLGGSFFLAFVGCVLGPWAYFALPAASSFDTGLIGPGSQLAGRAVPFVVVPALGMLLGALALWIGISILISGKKMSKSDD